MEGLATANRIHDWENSMEQQYKSLSMFLTRFMQECGPSSSLVYCSLNKTTNSYVLV